MKKLTLLPTSLLLLCSVNAFALDVKQRFNHLDSNSDGYLTQVELDAQPKLRSQYSKWDKDEDNQISLIEFKSYLTDNLY